MKKLVWLDGTEVGMVEHSMMVVEEAESEFRVLTTGDNLKELRQYASRSSMLRGERRFVDIYEYRSEWDNTTGWVKIAAYVRGTQYAKTSAARA